MKRTLVILFFSFPIFTFSAQKYYYFKGNKVSLPISDSVDGYTCSDPALYRNRDVCLIQEQTISRNEANHISKEKILSKEYVIGDNSASIKMSNHFYVKLRSFDDYDKLYQLAEDTHALLIGEVPHMNKWYDLMVTQSLYDNSLDMANYFYETRLFEDVDPGFSFEGKPSCVTDNLYPKQWALPAIHACDAWQITKGHPNIKIAIVDTGIDTTHMEFSDNKFLFPYDCVTNDQTSTIYDEHGTQVCGVISSKHDETGIAGIAPNVTIIPISNDSYTPQTFCIRAASGISWAVNHGADVINCSWGLSRNSFFYNFDSIRSAVLENAIDSALTYGRDGKGCVLVFASGNNTVNVNYPADIDHRIIVVGAINDTLTQSHFSNYGNSLDVVAPGENIITTSLYNHYDSIEGTSFAAPYVSGIAALVLSVNPNLTNLEVAKIIESTAVKITPYSYSSTRPGYPIPGPFHNEQWNLYVGYGLVDAYAAVKAAMHKKYIQNETYFSGTSVEEFDSNIFAGYSVSNEKPYGQVTIKTGSNVTYTAACTIHLESGFQVERGGSFCAQIGMPVSNITSSAPVRKLHNITNVNNSPTENCFIQHYLTITPNPATDHITISYAEPLATTLIYNLSGQLVLQTTGLALVGATSPEINVSALPTGIYILHAHTSSSQILQSKFVKL